MKVKVLCGKFKYLDIYDNFGFIQASSNDFSFLPLYLYIITSNGFCNMRQIHRSILHYCYLQDCSSPRHWNTSCFHRLYTNHGTYNKLNIISYLRIIVGSTRLFWYPEMINLEIFNIKFLEITALSIGYKLSPTVCPIFCRVLLICQLL